MIQIFTQVLDIEVKIKKCKTFRKALQTVIGQYHKKGNFDFEHYTKGLLDLFNSY